MSIPNYGDLAELIALARKLRVATLKLRGSECSVEFDMHEPAPTPQPRKEEPQETREEARKRRMQEELDV